MSDQYTVQAAVEFITQHFNLKPAGQDWELENAAPDRLIDFLDAYENLEINDDCKFALMALIVASYDDYLHGNLQQGTVDAEMSGRIQRLLCRDFRIHQNIIDSWRCPDAKEPEKNPQAPEFTFFVTPMMREIWDKA